MNYTYISSEFPRSQKGEEALKVLSIQRTTKKYGAVTAVDDVSLDIPEGQMVGVIGRSGAGKSTLLRLINRTVDATSGSIHFEGQEVTTLKGRNLLEWRARCAMIFQQFNLVNRLDVITNVLIGRLSYHGTIPSLFNRFSSLERALAVRALDRLEMVPQALQRADTLSGGQQQRVAIARALVQEPKILLADEPIASLDLRSATRVMEALRTINLEDGITVICNLHTLDTARSYCDRIIGMAEGKVVFDGDPAGLTSETIKAIYGADHDAAFDENITSTGVGASRSEVLSKIAIASV